MSMHAQPLTPLAPTDSNETESLARRLEASGDYKVLRRLVPRPPTPAPTGYAGKIGIVLDFETTGLDAAKDEIIEVAMVKFRYSDGDEITGVDSVFQSYNQPSIAIPPAVTELTGITDDVVAGHRIDNAALEAFVADAHVVIAHNAGFDRKFAERSWPLFEHKPWACSQTEIDWRKHGFGGAKLGYLLADIGRFHNAHRAIDDCHALVEILRHPLPATARPMFSELMTGARRSTARIWAQRSPFELKDALKARGYRWNDGTDGRPKSWFIDVDDDQRDIELSFLKKEIYQHDVDIECRTLTALDRFSHRV